MAESQAQVTFADCKLENEYFVRSEFFQNFLPDDLKEIQVRKRLISNFLRYLGQLQFSLNHRGEDPYLAFLAAFGRTEADLRNKNLAFDLGDLMRNLENDFGDEEEIDESAIPFPTAEYGKVWFCRDECGYWCHGKNWARNRTKHQKKCEHWKKLPSAFDYRHMSSRCICCVVPGQELLGRSKPFGTKFCKCKGNKVEKVLEDLKKMKRKLKTRVG